MHNWINGQEGEQKSMQGEVGVRALTLNCPKHFTIPTWGVMGRGSHPEGATMLVSGGGRRGGAGSISSRSSPWLLSFSCSLLGDLLRNKRNERWASANSDGSENASSYSSSASSASSRVPSEVCWCPRTVTESDWVMVLSWSAVEGFKCGTGDSSWLFLGLPIISHDRKCANLLELELETFTGQSQEILVISFPRSCVSRLAEDEQNS